MVTSAQVFETSVNVITNSPSQDCIHPDDHTLPTYDMAPGFKPFTDFKLKKKTKGEKRIILKTKLYIVVKYNQNSFLNAHSFIKRAIFGTILSHAICLRHAYNTNRVV